MTRYALIFFTTFLLYAAAIALGIYLGVSQVSAQAAPQCAPRTDVIAGLARNYGETRRGIGLGVSNTMMEFFASDATGSWTITVTMPDGITCLIASGTSFETIVEALPPQGIPG